MNPGPSLTSIGSASLCGAVTGLSRRVALEVVAAARWEEAGRAGPGGGRAGAPLGSPRGLEPGEGSLVLITRAAGGAGARRRHKGPPSSSRVPRGEPRSDPGGDLGQPPPAPPRPCGRPA